MLASRVLNAVGRIKWSAPVSSSLSRINGGFSTDSKEAEASEIKQTELPPDNNLQEDIKKLNATVEDLKDKYQRSLAENENVRKRLRKEISESKLYGIQSFCKDLLDVADVLKMAITSIPEEKIMKETDKLWKGFFEGVCLTDKELHTVFERHGLKLLNPDKGQKFDPYDHEALFETPVEGLDPGTIAHIQRVGYKLNGRTIRPAQVGVTPK